MQRSWVGVTISALSLKTKYYILKSPVNLNLQLQQDLFSDTSLCIDFLGNKQCMYVCMYVCIYSNILS